MNTEIYYTLHSALSSLRRTEENRRIDDKLGPLGASAQRIIDSQVDKIDMALVYIKRLLDVDNINSDEDNNINSDEFTSIKMRKIADEKGESKDKIAIKNIKEAIKEAAEENNYSRRFTKIESEKVRGYFRLRGFNLEDGSYQQDRDFTGVTYDSYTEISW